MLERTQSRLERAERIRERRRRSLRRRSILLSLLLIIFVGASIWLSWQPYVRISSVVAVNADQSIATLAQPALTGSYLYIVPRDSTFFVPARAIRTAVLAAHPEIAALSITHKDATTLQLKATERVAVGSWCGLKESPGLPAYCYYFDAGGYLFTAVDVASSSTPAPLNSFILYDSLAETTQEPLRATLSQASDLPSAFDFARQITNLGGQVTSVTIADNGEITDQLASGTSIVYVLGQEQAAFAELASAKSTYNLSDGSVAYIDLRFPGKIYLKTNAK